MDFTCKARYVAGGHKTEDLITHTYVRVARQDSIRIGFLLVSLNGLDVLSPDVARAYLNAPCHEKVYTHYGLEFSVEHAGKWAIITKALYSLKTSAFAWCEELGGTLHQDLAFWQCKAGNDDLDLTLNETR